MSDVNKYLKSTEFFDFHRKKVKEKAFEIVKGLTTEKEKAIALFYWVRDVIKYEMTSFYMIKSNFKASTTLRRGYGFCVSKSVLLATLARANGIPARIHLVDIINHKIPQKWVKIMGTEAFYYHGYTELLLNGKWLKAAAIIDKETAIRGKLLPLVEFDGENDGLFASHDTEGNIFVEYIGDRGIHSNLPYEDIEKVFNEIYGHAIEKGFEQIKPRKKRN